ncbi:Rv1733c family protein [Streptomyces cuspidosporus]|uniref:Integral membrane protein n=1 Tax=Streptomyces cuspidosporus TaxID=66882 RepID=A0ABP5TBK2_9ACTN
MRTIRGLWRWRRNPLRRPTDLAEAWAALVAALLIVLVAPGVGWATGALTHGALRETVREQRAQRHLVSATVVKVLPHPRIDSDPETASTRDAHRRVFAKWTGPDGSEHTGALGTHPGADAGERFRIWTDDRGRPTGRPLDEATAATHAVLAGTAAAAGTAGLFEGARRLVVWRLMRRRFAQWDTAWERAGQDWGRAGADS